MFILDEDPAKCARYHMDVHVISQCKEIVQVLCTTAFLQGCDADWLKENVHGATHIHHPIVKWLSESYYNVKYAIRLARRLNVEYRVRWNKDVNHKSIQKLMDNLERLEVYWKKLPHIPRTPFALTMPEEFHKECPVESYRAFYHSKEGPRMGTWKSGQPPWWKQ